MSSQNKRKPMGKEEVQNVSLEDNRIIYINGDFTEEMAKEVFEKIVTLEISNPRKDILLMIDSYGGYVHSYLAIHDAIMLSRCNVATFCIGKAMSCGQLLLTSGAKGKRFASKNSRIMMHEISSMSWGKLTDMEVDLNESKELQKIVNRLTEDYTGLSKSKIKKLLEKDSFLSAEEAKNLGIIDHVVENRDDLYKRINL